MIPWVWVICFMELHSGGEPCPICTLGECGDVNCPAYRPKHPEIREAVEETVVRHCM